MLHIFGDVSGPSSIPERVTDRRAQDAHVMRRATRPWRNRIGKTPGDSVSIGQKKKFKEIRCYWNRIFRMSSTKQFHSVSWTIRIGLLLKLGIVFPTWKLELSLVTSVNYWFQTRLLHFAFHLHVTKEPKNSLFRLGLDYYQKRLLVQTLPLKLCFMLNASSEMESTRTVRQSPASIDNREHFLRTCGIDKQRPIWAYWSKITHEIQIRYTYLNSCTSTVSHVFSMSLQKSKIVPPKLIHTHFDIPEPVWLGSCSGDQSSALIQFMVSFRSLENVYSLCCHALLGHVLQSIYKYDECRKVTPRDQQLNDNAPSGYGSRFTHPVDP